MKKTILSVLVAATFITSGAAFATPGGEGDNTGCNGVGNPNSPCAGNSNAVAGAEAFSANINVNKNSSSSSNTTSFTVVNSPSNTLLQNQSLSQGQSQTNGSVFDNSVHMQTTTQEQVANGGNATQNQKQKVDNSGNNTGTANVVVQGDQAQARNPVSTAVAPTIITGSDQCLVPVSAGGQGIGFGISFGTAVEDKICEALKLARELRSMGFPDQALKLLKNADTRVSEAFSN